MIHIMSIESLTQREAFHLNFLRLLVRVLPVATFAVKGGCNLRFFFGSVRYSEDLDLDVADVPVHVLTEKVLAVLRSPALAASMRTFGVERIQLPDMARAKQTETVQRFKVHVVTSAAEDLSTKIEFSRRGLDQPRRAEAVRPEVLASQRMPPLIVPHYTAPAATRQKIQALISRRQPEARDVFDLDVLRSHPDLAGQDPTAGFTDKQLHQAIARIDGIDFPRFRDTVLDFLDIEDRATYDSADVWDQIRLGVIALIERRPGREV